AVAEAGRDDQDAPAADLHALHALVPALDHHAAAEREDEGLVPVLAGIELDALLAVLVEPAGVVHGDVAAGRGLCAVADDAVFELQAGGGGGECHWGVSSRKVRPYSLVVPRDVRCIAAPIRAVATSPIAYPPGESSGISPASDSSEWIRSST